MAELETLEVFREAGGEFTGVDMALPESSHYVGSLLTDHIDLLFEPDGCVDAIEEATGIVGANIVGRNIKSFKLGEEQAGFSLTFLLLESHIAVHTWPEISAAEFDVYLCNASNVNNSNGSFIFDAITEYFNPKLIAVQEIKRSIPRLEEAEVNDGAQDAQS